jgi:serine/threonine protein kinase
MIGAKLAHYEITSHLGTGGMGEGYQATDSKLGRSVAIKLLPATFASDPDREAMPWRSLLPGDWKGVTDRVAFEDDRSVVTRDAGS